MTGTLIAGRYSATQLIGSGAMGSVWRARDARLDREVAVKIVDLSAMTDPSIGVRFQREAIATAALNHPNIVSVFDAGVDGSTAYLVMELLSGPSLAAVVRDRGRLDVATAISIGRQVAAALAAAHGAGLVHRDVKPANVMLGDQVKLLDFGIAQLAAADATLTAPASAIGTAAYMSPEQAMGTRVGPASDMYALGCLMMTMLTGAPPFGGDSAIAVASLQVSAEPPRVSERRPDVPAALDDLVGALLAKASAARPDAPAALAALRALDGVQAPGGATAISAVHVPAETRPAHQPTPTKVLPAVPPPIKASPELPTRTPVAPRLAVAPRRRSGARLALGVALVFLLGAGMFWAGSQFPFPVGATGSSSANPATQTPTAATPATQTPTTQTSATPRPSASAASSRPAPSASVATTAPSAAKQAALQAAVAGVGDLINRLPSDTGANAKARDQLTKQWDQNAGQIVAGRNSAKRVDDMSATVESLTLSGGLPVPSALLLRAALQVVKVLV